MAKYDVCSFCGGPRLLSEPQFSEHRGGAQHQAALRAWDERMAEKAAHCGPRRRGHRSLMRCRWCNDPIITPYAGAYCSRHCEGQHHAQTYGAESSPLAWDGHDRYAMQLPLPLHWRLVCMLCARDRWLHMPLEQARQLRPGPCATCRGFRVLELDYGARDPSGVEAA